MTTSVDVYWQQMVTAALLGTDRRDPPVPPDGGLADLADQGEQQIPHRVELLPVAFSGEGGDLLADGFEIALRKCRHAASVAT